MLTYRPYYSESKIVTRKKRFELERDNRRQEIFRVGIYRDHDEGDVYREVPRIVNQLNTAINNLSL